MRRGQAIVLESTTFPGTTREYLVPLLEEWGLRAGEDFALAFSPERVDPGRTDYTVRPTPKTAGGLTDACTERAVAVCSQWCDRVFIELAGKGERQMPYFCLEKNRAGAQ